ncbi:MAG: Tex-like N-terminal domain-containing protein [Planctomycetia bacterium]|nr:Tex-like N-terminal domain-containing protein [Planctomycetia bacterium]
MSARISVSLGEIAASVGLPLGQIESTVELLDAGNTIPFITRYRKDQTGGLDEEQIRLIESRLARLRLLAERKQTILRSIESQGKLTPELAQAIQDADSTKRLEDLYLPFKPRKQTLATQARERGLEKLAEEILTADPACLDLDRRAADFINTDRKVATVADALLGAGHILAEWFSERADLRGKLREIVARTGRLISVAIDPERGAASTPSPKAEAPAPVATAESEDHAPLESVAIEGEPELAADAPEPESNEASHVEEQSSPAEATAEGEHAEESAESSPDEPPTELGESVEAASDAATEAVTAVEPAPTTAPAAAAHAKQSANAKAAARQKAKERERELKEKHQAKAFRDYFDFGEAISKVPPHRILAINRGERAHVLRVRVDSDFQAIEQAAFEALIQENHPHADLLCGCAMDALQRLIYPSLEREVRRELTDEAESHAVDVFARNLRSLLLQSPVRDRRLLAVDPGFKSGCKLAAIDEFGHLLAHAVVHLVGKEDRRAAAKAKMLEMIAEHHLSVIAIGNGTGCRETEEMVAEMLTGELTEAGAAYVIVNEAGASVYSTSPIGREEFPNYDATLRGAISIGRRLQDPLSELVKIDAANIGVGMYQHDVKAKHLRDSLDGVVESCVNFVGVDVNSASPALLRYVSGLNQLTARRVYDHRAQHGPFKSREDLKAVAGFGDAAFIQSAGFLKIAGGDNPLDTTWIHPESYAVATQVLERLGGATADLSDKQKLSELAGAADKLDLAALAAELQVGLRLLQDIVAQFKRPGRDPREELPQPIFKKGVLKLDDLAPGLELAGTVLNVVDFGAFVDVGLKDTGLVHVSQMADRYIQTPHQVVSVGDIVRVWVLEVDKERRRVSLTMIAPGTQRQHPEPRPRSDESRPPRDGRGPQQQQRRGGQQSQRPAPVGAGAGGPPAQRRARGGPPQGGNRKPQRRQQDYVPPPPPKPRPLVPITEKMRDGNEPMRTFGDLMQFFNQAKIPPEQPGDSAGENTSA